METLESLDTLDSTLMPPGQPDRARAAERRVTVRLAFTLLAVLVVGITAWASAPVVFRAMAQQQAAERAEKAMAENPAFRALQAADPTGYQRTKGLLLAAIRPDTSPTDLRRLVGKFAEKVTNERLARATPAALRQMAQVRVKMLDALMTNNPFACYEYITTSNIKGIEAELLTPFGRDVEAVLAQPLAPDPISYNEARATKQADRILTRLGADELLALQYPAQKWTDRTAYCRAILSIYRQALTLPDEECAAVLRYLHLFPGDDRKS